MIARDNGSSITYITLVAKMVKLNPAILLTHDKALQLMPITY